MRAHRTHPKRGIQLLCTDFDGTLLGGGGVHPSLWAVLVRLVEEEHIIWVINTGRTWEGLAHELWRLSPPVWPHWVVLGEREVYRIEAREPKPHKSWNELCQRAHHQLFERTRPFWRELLRYLHMESRARFTVDQLWSPVEIEATSEEEADRIHRFVRERICRWRSLSVVRNSRWFRFAHSFFHKGTALACIQRETATSPARTLAVGDHYNDLPMLEPVYAEYLACPANAIEPVKEKVRRYQGEIATGEASLGVLEVLEKVFLSASRSFSRGSRKELEE
ncbi:HAD family hydrolase [Candidatus Methylacidithermus pantelleriae]|uniref:HAD family hydrolase n=1 Tax=Candidatus Methylacidithermus pantelleriae TaxID=2744239 RepID=UPI001BD49F63|nr:HAD hydrolase family protein [Candidatus Methylacidithermus pantelleriae]